MNPFERFLCVDPAARAVLDLAARVATSNSSILIEGESGVGKDLLATAIHYASSRASGPFVRIDCPNLSEDLLECELFGYEPGAFTDAKGRKLGKFELANGGTLYVDGVEHLSLVLQAKLLRPLQERTIERLGATAPRALDCRLIASTQRSLAKEVGAGRFREDLYFRLQVLHLKIPPLRGRPQDITLLAESLVAEAGVRAGRPSLRISSEGVAALQKYHWPGNVRELRNLLDRLAMTAKNDTVSREEVLRALPDRDTFGAPPSVLTLRQVESVCMQEALKRAHGNKRLAADLLGISRKGLYDRMRRAGIKLH